MIVEDSRRDNQINALDLADFLYKFRAAYVVALSFVEYEYGLGSNASAEIEYRPDLNPFNISDKLKESFHRFISSNRSIASMSVLSKENLPYELDLNFLEISTNSPLHFIGYCTGASILALSLAVALAGGTADLEKKTFVVKPLLEATATIIKELRR